MKNKTLSVKTYLENNGFIINTNVLIVQNVNKNRCKNCKHALTRAFNLLNLKYNRIGLHCQARFQQNFLKPVTFTEEQLLSNEIITLLESVNAINETVGAKEIISEHKKIYANLNDGFVFKLLRRKDNLNPTWFLKEECIKMYSKASQSLLLSYTDTPSTRHLTVTNKSSYFANANEVSFTRKGEKIYITSKDIKGLMSVHVFQGAFKKVTENVALISKDFYNKMDSSYKELFEVAKPEVSDTLEILETAETLKDQMRYFEALNLARDLV